MKLAVIVTTYNRPDALALVLQGYFAQLDAGFELIVADDGSADETRQLVERLAASTAIPVRHVWQEDQGFRAAAIRNRAALTSGADYLVFTDGDCVPSINFVAAHRKLAERSCFLAGNRVLLDEALTAEVLARQWPIYQWKLSKWRRVRQSGGINRLLPLLSLPLPGWLRRITPARWRGAKTCNLSLWRDDFERINGFDERYCGWGLEDSDLVIRLLHTGVKHKSARFAAPVFHLWHREFDRLTLPENQARLDELLKGRTTRAIQGLDQYR